MRSAFTQLLGQVKDLPSAEFTDESMAPQTKKKCQVTLNMLVGIFDQKKGSKVEDMLKALPQQNLYVLDSLVNLFDFYGEEKSLTFDKILEETLGYCKNYGL